MLTSIVRADNEWRFDPVDRAWTVLALNRRTLPPPALVPSATEAALLAASTCPFCHPEPASSRGHGPAFGRSLDRVERGPWTLVALPSPTPLGFVEDGPPPTAPFVAEGALGAHELLVPLGERAHGATLDTLGKEGLSGLFTLFARRALDLREDRRLQSLALVFLPAPMGRLAHPHAALFATPFAGPEAKDAALCPLCEDLKAAHASGRVLLEEDGYTAFVPYAPRRTLHVRVAASRHGGVTTFAALERLETAAAANALATGVERVAKALARLMPKAPLSLSLPALSLARENAGAHALLELTCPLEVDTPLADALGVRVSTFPPEELAAALRRQLDR